MAYKLQKKLIQRWLLLTILSGLGFVVFTAIYATGKLYHFAWVMEQWLFLRPITRLDCTLIAWRHLIEAPISLISMLAIGCLCYGLGYRWKVIPLLVGVLLFCLGVEIVGKLTFDLPLPQHMRSAMTSLTCPQLHGQSLFVKVSAAFGLWWNVPEPSPVQVLWVRDVAKMPFVLTGDSENGYPSGHAMRACLLGLTSSWLLWRHCYYWWIRFPLVIFLCGLSLIYSFVQFYIGVHSLTDALAGCLLGIFGTCLAILCLIMTSSVQESNNDAVNDSVQFVQSKKE